MLGLHTVGRNNAFVFKVNLNGNQCLVLSKCTKLFTKKNKKTRGSVNRTDYLSCIICCIEYEQQHVHCWDYILWEETLHLFSKSLSMVINVWF
jgi:hypothetical protein